METRDRNPRRIEVVECSVERENFIDTRQIGIVIYREGGMLLHCKILRNKQGIVFAQLPQIHRQGTTVDVVRYIDSNDWKLVAKTLVSKFLEEHEQVTSERACYSPSRASDSGASG